MELNELTLKINQRLDELVPQITGPESLLYHAARYSLLSEGKRIRPLMALATCEIYGIPLQISLTPCCALEMIHAYSLIHDDLPCMDNDDFRRGKPTLHRAYDEGMAVLVGDYLLTRAFEVLAKDTILPPPQILELIKVLSELAGGKGMIGGQVIDIEGKVNSESSLSLMHQKKTGALIRASVLFGAIIGSASKEERRHLDHFAQKIGLAFQVIDDILDVTSPKAKRGGENSSDEKNSKKTYVTFLGMEHAQQAAQDLKREALSSLDAITLNTQPLRDIASLILQQVTV